jgi:hypothetical protein
VHGDGLWGGRGGRAAPAGLIAWWRADGNFLDSVGLNHLQADGRVGFSSGRFGQGFQFNGASSSAYCPGDAPALNDRTQFTLGAWINLDATNDLPVTAGRGIISRVGNSANHSLNFGYQFGVYDNSRQLFCQFNTNGQQIIEAVTGGGRFYRLHKP